jgi:serine/threonine protein kinase
MEALIGGALGQYRIIEQIGAGGMAAVFKAYQPSLERYVAIKVLPPLKAQLPGFSERFAREARAIAGLNHPNILPVYDFGQERGYSFIVMRYVEGARTLRDVMVKLPLDLATATDLIGQIAAALDHAHKRKVIHRDVKPDNVLMDGNWALLSDFGLARMMEASVLLTGSGASIGTAAYISPEQGQGLSVSHRTDIYALGIILFEMLTGQIPHDAEKPIAIIFKRVHEPLPSPRSLNPAIPEAVEWVILKALARDPDDRFASAGAMAAALRRGKAPLTVVVPPPGTLPVAPATTPSRPTWTGPPWQRVAGMGAVVGVVVMTVVGLAISLASGGKPAPIPVPTAEAAAMAPVATQTTLPTGTLLPFLTYTPIPIPPTDTPTAPRAPALALSPTSTPTATPTSTASPTPPPTATPSSPPSPTSKPTATPLPTPSPTRSVAQNQPTATLPGVAYPAPVLLQPVDGAGSGASVTFIWRWDGNLKDNEYFDLRVWREGEDHRQGAVDCKTTPRVPSLNGEYVVSANITKLGTIDRPAGEWYWSVAVLDMSGGEYNTAPDVSPEAEPRKLVYAPGGGGGKGGKGGKGGGGPPPP